jgi:S-DNA-T family DNA segregation ATPase FtsK/SpoIIIE
MIVASGFKGIKGDDLDTLLSNYMVNSWSFSKVGTFCRNEKAFEMSAIYGYKSKRSASSVAGNAYHEALKRFFETHPLHPESEAETPADLITLEAIAFDYIDALASNVWKTQKTTPTIEDCKKKANKIAVQLLQNFMKEVEVYLEDAAEIIAVEMFCYEWLTINGVDIPLPCRGQIDLVIRLKSGKVVVIDHKSKNSFSDAKEIELSIGKQAITYVHLYQQKTGIEVDEVWFVENKYSKNRDGSNQLNCFQVGIDEDTRKLYEALLYEPLRRMVEAVADPDYVYMLNDKDNFVDQAELHEFWCKTQIAEVEEFNVPEQKKDMIRKRLKKVRDVSIATANPNVIKKFRENAAQFIQYDLTNKNMTLSEKIEHVLRTFQIMAQVAHTIEGYSSNTYLLELSAGTKIQAVHSRRLDLAAALNVANVRIKPNLHVYEGKSFVAIEAPKKREKDLNWSLDYMQDLAVPIGRNNYGETIVWDLNNHSTPHMLICGATGSGKSVCIKSTMEYIAPRVNHEIDNVVVLDLKYEFGQYNDIPGFIVYQEIEEIESAVSNLVKIMNSRVRKGGKHKKIVVVMDEFADAFLMARKGKDLEIWEEVQDGFYKQSMKERDAGYPPQPKMKKMKTGVEKSLEENLQSLLQKGRSLGFHLVMATQRASAKVISGDLKVNLPVQICFRVPKEVDSKVVIDESGAESLAGYGDGLIRSPQYMDVERFQGFWKD